MWKARVQGLPNSNATASRTCGGGSSAIALDSYEKTAIT